MTRFAEGREALPAAQRAAWDVIAGRRGTVPAPFLPLLASPHVANLFEQFSSALWNGKLDRATLELVFLVTARAWNCEYQWRTHETKALAAGVPLELVEAIRLRSELPTDAVDKRLLDIARFARFLQERALVPDDLFEGVRQQLGDAGFSELVAFCALAGSVALLLNVRVDDAASGADVDAMVPTAQWGAAAAGS